MNPKRILLFDIHGTVHRGFSRNTNKMQVCNRIYYFEVYWRLNMFRAAHRSSSGALNCVCSLWFYIHMLWPTVALARAGIINSITKLHRVGISTEFYYSIRLEASLTHGAPSRLRNIAGLACATGCNWILHSIITPVSWSKQKSVVMRNLHPSVYGATAPSGPWFPL
jgi:hypothetical protein